MQKNMGTADRVIRIVVALGLIILLLTGRVSGVLSIVLGVVAGVFLATSALAVCPAYGPLKLSTRKEPPRTPGA